MLKQFREHMKAMRKLTADAIKILLGGEDVIIIFPFVQESQLSARIVSNMDQDTQETALCAIVDQIDRQNEIVDEARDLLGLDGNED